MRGFKDVLISHFQSVYDRAMFNFDNLDKNRVGIGEHTDLVEDGIKWIERAANAKGCIELLNHVDQQGNPAVPYGCEEGL